MTAAQQRGTQPSPTADGPAYSWSPPRQLWRRPPLRRLPHQPRPVPADLSAEAVRMHRPTRITGVCARLGLHLGILVRYIRTLMVVLALGGGTGVPPYALLWTTFPGENEPAGKVPVSAISRARLVARFRGGRGTAESWADGGAPLGLSQTVLDGDAPLLVALFPVSRRFGLLDRIGVARIIITVIAEAALAWSQMDNLAGPDHNPSAILRMVSGVCLAVIGVLVWVAADSTPYKLVSGLLTRGAPVVDIGMVLVLLWLRTNRVLVDIRAIETCKVERAGITAHLHDFIFQTLTLIRKRTDKPEAVACLTRSQERELRAWLYTDRPAPGASVTGAFTDLANEIEDRYGVAASAVCVGGWAPGRDTEVAIAVAREALSNAVRHGAPPASLYVKAGEESLEAFTRDRGPDFDFDAIAEDRHGVHQSIIARMERHGGSVRVCRMSTGTEVALTLPACAP